MAQIEAELGVKATYFVQIHNDFYNTFEKENINSILKIKNLGQQIGLHFDSHFWDIKTEKQLENQIKIDKNILEEYISDEIKVFLFHNNTDFTLYCRNEKFDELLNVYLIISDHIMATMHIH
jgi:hypothetical protein